MTIPGLWFNMLHGFERGAQLVEGERRVMPSREEARGL